MVKLLEIEPYGYTKSMPFYKWCLLLIRIMSPQTVGLIYFLLIGGLPFVISSSSRHFLSSRTSLLVTTDTPTTTWRYPTTYAAVNRNNVKRNSSNYDKNNTKLSVRADNKNSYLPAASSSVNQNSEIGTMQRNFDSDKEFSLNKHDFEYLFQYLQTELKSDLKQETESRHRVRDILNNLLSLNKSGYASINSNSSAIYNEKKVVNKLDNYAIPNYFRNNMTVKININNKTNIEHKNLSSRKYNGTNTPEVRKPANTSSSIILRRPSRRNKQFEFDMHKRLDGKDRELHSNTNISQEFKNISVNNHKKIDDLNITSRLSRLSKQPEFFNVEIEDVKDFFVDPVTIPYKNNDRSENCKHCKNLTIYEVLRPRLRSAKMLNRKEILSIPNTTKFPRFPIDSETNTVFKNDEIFVKDYLSTTLPAQNNKKYTLQKSRSDSIKSIYSTTITSERNDNNYATENSQNVSEPTTSPDISDLISTPPFSDKYSKAYIEKQENIRVKVAAVTLPSVTTSLNEFSEYNANESLNSSIKTNKDDSIKIENGSINLDLPIMKMQQESDNFNETLQVDVSEMVTEVSDVDLLREPKMSYPLNTDNSPFKKPNLDPKMFYDYFAKKPSNNVTSMELPFPEYRPGHLFRSSDGYQRKPVIDVVYTAPTPVFEIFRPTTTTEDPFITSTTFDSIRTSVKVSSTFYPNRMQDVTMVFGNRGNSMTTLPSQKAQNRNDDDVDDEEFRDALDAGFTMEKLAYLLIGTCCGLSILCLCIVVVAIKCRRAVVERRLKSQFRKRMYQHERMKDPSSPWQQQMFDHLMYLRRQPGDSSCSTSATDCNCRCVTWSLGPRNLESSNSSGRPMCGPNNRNSLFLCGQKKLPFGAASTLRYESMLGRSKKPPPNAQKNNDSSPNTDSSHENDSLDQDSHDSREGNVMQCTCIDYNVWPLSTGDVRRGFYGLYPSAGRYNLGECIQHPAVELRSIARDLPPPVTGSNYLDRSEGVVYWSSNDERLI